jgi:hypothetical protein
MPSRTVSGARGVRSTQLVGGVSPLAHTLPVHPLPGKREDVDRMHLRAGPGLLHQRDGHHPSRQDGALLGEPTTSSFLAIEATLPRSIR